MTVREASSSARVFLPRPGSTANRRFRASYGKRFHMVCLSHLETINVFYRALRRSGLPLVFTEGEHPHPKASFSPALPVGVESHAEFIDFWLLSPMDLQEVADSLRSVLPEGFFLSDVATVPEHAPSLEASIHWMEYEATFVQDGVRIPSGVDLIEVLAAFRNSCDPKNGSGEIDNPLPRALRHVVELDSLDATSGLRLRLMRRSGSIPSPFKILEFLFPDPPWSGLRFGVRKTRTFLLNVPDQADAVKRPVPPEGRESENPI